MHGLPSQGCGHHVCRGGFYAGRFHRKRLLNSLSVTQLLPQSIWDPDLRWEDASKNQVLDSVFQASSAPRRRQKSDFPAHTRCLTAVCTCTEVWTRARHTPLRGPGGLRVPQRTTILSGHAEFWVSLPHSNAKVETADGPIGRRAQSHRP